MSDKYRIKVRTFPDGRQTYMPQQKYLLWWFDLSRMSSAFEDISIWLNTKEEAEKVIENDKNSYYTESIIKMNHEQSTK